MAFCELFLHFLREKAQESNESQRLAMDLLSEIETSGKLPAVAMAQSDKVQALQDEYNAWVAERREIALKKISL